MNRRASKQVRLWDRELMRLAAVRALVMLRPDFMWKNPVMFVVEIGTVLSLLMTVQKALDATSTPATLGYLIALDAWLIATILFANFAEALAEARGKAQADALRKTKQATTAFRRQSSGKFEPILSTELTLGDVVAVEAGQMIPADGEILEGVASVDESAITGESAPVIREAGGDRSGVTGGTRVLSDRIVIRVTVKPGESFLDQMIALVEGAKRKRTPNELALSIVLAAFTLIFLIVTATLWPLARYAENSTGIVGLGTDIPTLVALLVCLIPTTIGALLAAIGIAGMDRALRANIIAKSGKAVEVAGDVDTLLLDKTGTITMGNRRATRFLPAGAWSAVDVARLAAWASAADETPEGKSIVELWKQYRDSGDRGLSELGSSNGHDAITGMPAPETFRVVPFSAHTRMSGIDRLAGEPIRKGATDAMLAYVQRLGGTVPAGVREQIDAVASEGATPLVVAEGNRIAGIVVLEDILKPGIRERFERLRKMGLRTVMVTGDNPLTAQSIAQQAGVDDFIAEATPEAKLAYIRREQASGKLVAMMGDGTNDAPALAQADVGVAMNSGTQAAKEAGNMVDLDSDPTKLIEVVEVGKQLLMTRGALTTFSIANDMAKYFAIVPALFAGTLPGLKRLDFMQLTSPTSAILSAVIFNAIIIPCLIPIALKGVRYRPVGADALLRRNLLIWGLGGVITPFVGIKAIDWLLAALGLA
ncbi:potassium-transporting ATPase subunit KdpB [Tuwongella immobilis]|uniref:Potassium-transporting ATPase ATP-binding subunit n=1 Tax=Tuwongella immobilis TaxID=692036 RepID=A0A6C2YSB9_9BACT|nr:potassium-transporting ATPase subunit KdpB [Tuwongella immobilis]VIP04261.1 potassium transporter : Potassium-transporting ATPase B chain OS=Syntrophobacter fumaroxidans (strain DSM 10017 / MPOB) GN=kdpB PE=3 SV=1: E1-E2_ATPase: Hydrolase [Tuwongella immobilis]VTS05885.1 potassium transporter : Potassium-transporting ATPase B chain OS=Syntrophobacter fumaroxidans (strain DSM 10017 / MPOB) GN=kdpB PE=3 SV=1: E1-E2_ATPase: Hydrolase [Tuwongella immobilis]